MKNFKKISLLIFSLCLVISLSACGEKTAGTNDPAQTGPLFAKFTTQDINGEARDEKIFADYDVTMVNIWGSFCAPCIDEMPDLAKINKEYADKKFQVVGIVADVIGLDGKAPEKELKAAQEIIAKTGADYMHLLPSQDLMDLKLKDVTGVPETIFIDKTGAVIGESYLGSRSYDDWVKIIDEKLEQVK